MENKVTTMLFVLYISLDLVLFSLCHVVYLSLGSTIITTNNTKILITDIGVDAPFGGLPSLTCHTDLRACCRNSDTGGQGGRGAWYYPDGREVQNFAGSTAAGDGFYKVRNAPRVIRLARRTKSAPVGSYCCVIPTTKGVETFCALLSKCMFVYIYNAVTLHDIALESWFNSFVLNYAV